MARKTADEKREGNRIYMKTYREHNPVSKKYSLKSNLKRKEMLKALPSVECKCGGSYKKHPLNKQKHCDTYKHQAWFAEQQLIALMVKAGEANDEAGARRQLERRFDMRGAYTDKRKVVVMDELGENINGIMKAKNHTEEVKPRPKTKETHHERIIRIAAEAQDSESSEEEPQNVIIEAKNSPPPTPCPSSSEAESEESDETETETETEDGSDCSTQTESEPESEESNQLNDDKEIALRRFNRFKDAKPADSYAPPPPKFDMCEYLEEASITTDDGSDILKKLGLLTHNKKGSEKYQFL